MFKFLGRLFDENDKELKKLASLVEEVNSYEPAMKKLKDSQFPKKTAEFRDQLKGVKETGDLLPQALALAREAIRREVGERAFDVQIMAAIALHQGKIAEQKTGEGKTLSAAIAAYVNALSGKSVHVVTVNDYLARRDVGWYGRALNFSGLSLGCIIHEQAFLLDEGYEEKSQTDERLRHLRPVERKEAYLADVTYGTNNEYGFDYLRDNMVQRKEDKVQRGHNFAIVDEVDSILIDEARTPLIISAPDVEPTEKYVRVARLIKGLAAGTDYSIDEKLRTATLTDYGIRRVEKLLGVVNLYETDFDTIHHVENALKALTLFHRDKDYVVKDDQVVIVDEFTGRLMFGRRWSDGLHQAVEAKEGVKIQQESITMATISFQNYFRMYKKLAGMTGTAATEAEEFEKIYKLQTLAIPTNKPMVRHDFPDVIYKTKRVKYTAVAAEIEECYHRGQPVLVGTTSIENNEIVSRLLEKKGISHQVLNAKRHEQEARILAEAGKLRGVTVATNMAGRGVDIVLGGSKLGDATEKQMTDWEKEHQAVIGLGGLRVIGTERHESRRIDNQLRGRSGRQGDPGSSRFYISLEDDIMRIFGGEQISRFMEILKIPEDQPIEHGMVSKAIEQSQIRVEGFNFDMRKRVVEYDDVMNRQREIIYGRRDNLLENKEDLSLKEKILENIGVEIEGMAAASYSENGSADLSRLVAEFCEILPFDEESRGRLKNTLENSDSQKIQEILTDIVRKAYETREKQFGEHLMREIESVVYLQAIDRLWIDHLDAMDNLREGIGLRGYGQQDPLVEYKKEAFASFEKLLVTVDAEVSRRIFRLQLANQGPTMPTVVQTNVDRSDGMGLSSGKPKATSKISSPSGKKVGRNDPCPCGATKPDGTPKKYKHCCYPKYG